MNANRAAASGTSLSGITDQLHALVADGNAGLAGTLVHALLDRVDGEDLAAHASGTWAELVNSLFRQMLVREPGTASAQVFNPEAGDCGTVVQIVTDDMPFLVDSVRLIINRSDASPRMVLHPVLGVRRDKGGRLEAIGADAGKGAIAESLLHFELDRIADAGERKRLQAEVLRVLADVRAAVADWQAMRDKMLSIADELPGRRTPLDDAGLREAQEFLRWVSDDHFTYLGYREYVVVERDDDEVLEAIEDSGLGLLRGGARAMAPRSLKTLAATELPQSGAIDAIILTKTNSRADVHRPGYMDYIGVLQFDDNGRPVGEQRFLGLYTSTAYMRRPQDVPLLRQKVAAVMQRSGFRGDSHSGKALRHILETLPREELLQCTVDELESTARGVLDLRERARPRVFVRRDKYGRFFSCLAFVPRDRFNTNVRERVEGALKRAFRGEHVQSTLLLDESPLARLHIVIRPRAGEVPEYDAEDLGAKLSQIVRNWHDDLREILVQRLGVERGQQLARRYGRALPASYIEEVTAQVAAGDVEIVAGLSAGDDLRLVLYRARKGRGELRFKVFRYGTDIGLSDVLPLLENMGLRVHTEHLYELDVASGRLFIQDFEVKSSGGLAFDIDQVGGKFEHAFEAIWRGRAENDGFNRLVLSAGLTWRQVAVLRGYCKYLLQVGVTFSQAYMEDTFNHYPLAAGLLVELFEAKFDPDREKTTKTALNSARKRMASEISALLPAAVAQANPEFAELLLASRTAPRAEQEAAVIQALRGLLDNIRSVDEDRIFRSFIDVIRATLRTNAFQLGANGEPAEYISYKLDCHKVPDLPKPQPFREIFVCSPRVEGIHLRFGPVARGGLRWSDRREDFRTEVLGLVKAQMVKNTVIVPVGSKGGFFVKRPPAGGDRDAILAEGIACYSIFNNGLLDITDNLVDGKVVHPERVVRHDGDDPYLVVAADKGTARFSDIANRIAIEHGYWLGDAYASGGSAGYDHKAMGITAKGGWESVKRHFRSLGRDCQREDFTCVGIGDMSGDVFGNGMLLSRHIRLVAAFDHRDIFIDPDPDIDVSFAERQRLFDLPRSSWQDYDAAKISAGGGVYPRSAKAIELSPQARQALGLPASDEPMPVNEVLRAILKAPVDLLWNGGIGTYVKSAGETHADVGDRANNPLRINGGELRCKIVGEGGNLGFTQKGRVEAARKGVLLNTDFIDNSAGVDTSDHEVNIKILLNDAVHRGEITVEQRNEQLAAMTDEVERLVLWDNYRQNQAITLMEHMSIQRMGSKRHFIRTLEAEGMLDRQIESLPSDEELGERRARGEGLTRPELAILLSYSKIRLYQQLLDSAMPEDPYLSRELVRYFPEPLREKYAEHMQRHRLKREIIATAVTNSIVNRMGATFTLRMQEDTGQTPMAVAKAFNAAREILDIRSLWADIEALDGTVSEGTQIDAVLKIWALLRSVTRWLLNRPGVDLDVSKLVARYQPGVTELKQALPAALTATGKGAFGADVEKWQGLGCPQELAERLARVPVLGSALDVVEVAHESDHKVAEVAEVFFELGEGLDLEWLRLRVEELPVESRWHAQARGSLRDELNAQQRALAVNLLARPLKGKGGAAVVREWLASDDPVLKFTLDILGEISSQSLDYPLASVAVRRLAQLAMSGEQ
ncbi:MAG TPA: NAD-glutamate dehydrogenase [Rhodanobacteraceae bacterium]|nr:NAD-glutamate dehydrogenase [Rhodanobacteraceae bacterium]